MGNSNTFSRQTATRNQNLFRINFQRNRNILTNMKLFTFVIAITITLASSQDVQFSGDDEVPVTVETRADGIGEDDVNSRIFGNIDLNSFAGNVAAAAVGSVVGNVGTNLASNYLNGCSNRGKRSVLMHKLEKRQAIEAAEKSGNADADPEVQTRLFCPQDFLNPGGSAGNNNYRYCDRCSCRDYDCNRDCRKCVINNNNGYPSGWSSNSGNSGSSGSSWSSNSNTGWSSNSGSNNRPTYSNSINCSSCSCSSSSSCRRYCTSRCQNNYYQGSSGSSWNNGGSYNTGWRVAGRTNKDSEATDEVANDTEFEQKLENVDEAVVFA